MIVDDYDDWDEPMIIRRGSPPSAHLTADGGVWVNWETGEVFDPEECDWVTIETFRARCAERDA